jgi:hypothetical protein
VPGNRHQAHDQAAEDVVESATEIRGLENEREHQRDQNAAHQKVQVAGVGAGQPRDNRAQLLAGHAVRGEVDGARGDPAIEELVVKTHAADIAPQHVIRRDRGDGQHHQRLEVAAADAHAGLVATARTEGHADTEHHTAQHIAQPGEVAGAVRREGVGRQRQLARALENHHAEQRHGHGEQPGAQPAGIAHVHPVGHRAHGAEVGLVGDRAQHHGRQKHQAQHLKMNRELHNSSGNWDVSATPLGFGLP